MNELDPQRTLLCYKKNRLSSSTMLANYILPQQRDDTLSTSGVTIHYLRNIRCDGDSKEVHGQVHTSHHDDKQAVARVAVATQALLEGVKQMIRETEREAEILSAPPPPIHSRELPLCL